MNDNRRGHRHGRNPRGFDNHRMQRGSGKVRNGRPWRFNVGVERYNPCEPHYRVTARIAALPGKHMRSVREPVRATHGKA